MLPFESQATSVGCPNQLTLRLGVGVLLAAPVRRRELFAAAEHHRPALRGLLLLILVTMSVPLSTTQMLSSLSTRMPWP